MREPAGVWSGLVWLVCVLVRVVWSGLCGLCGLVCKLEMTHKVYATENDLQKLVGVKNNLTK